MNFTQAFRISSAIAAVALTAWIFNVERLPAHWWGPWLGLSFALFIFCLAALLTRRLSVSLAIVATLFAATNIISDIKRNLLGIGLHSSDIILYAVSWPNIKFVFDLYPVYAITFFAGLIVFALCLWVLARIEVPQFKRIHAATGLAVAAVCIALTASKANQMRPRGLGVPKTPAFSTFFLSIRDLGPWLVGGRLVQLPFDNAPRTAPQAVMAGTTNAAAPVFASTTAHCGTDLPNIILIHHESIFPPVLYSQINYDKSLDDFFQSSDGKTRLLDVEVFGGGSHLSYFTLLTAIPTTYLHGLSGLAHVVMANRLRAAMPQVLKSCGYGTSILMPVPEHFSGLGRFHKSIGFSDIYDSTRQTLTGSRSRDRDHYDFALSLLANSKQNSPTPSFIYIQTLASHGPYDKTLSPEIKLHGGSVPGAPAILDATVNEYLRRTELAKLDFEYFKQELAQRFPHQKFLFVRYGDHQPHFTRVWADLGEEAGSVIGSPLLIKNKTSIARLTTAEHPKGFTTFYSLSGLNFEPRALPAGTRLDMALLSTAALYAAGLNLPYEYELRKRLIDLCGGQYLTCSRTDLLTQLHHEMRRSGAIDD